MDNEDNVIAKCQMCGAEYPERDAKDETEYECVECGGVGYDCCVPGTRAICTNCEDAKATR